MTTDIPLDSSPFFRTDKDSSGESLRGMTFTGDLSGYNFSGSDLQGANFDGTTLTGSDFADSILLETSFKSANLQLVDFTDATGLSIDKLGGSNLLGALLPDNIGSFDGLHAIREASLNAGKLCFALFLTCAYSLLVVASTQNGQLLGNIGRLRLPVLQASVPIIGFYFTSPLLIVLGYALLGPYLGNIFVAMARLPAVFPDGDPIEAKVFPWVVTFFGAEHLRRSRGPRESPLFSAASFVVLSTWITVPLTELMLWGRYAGRLALSFHLADFFIVLTGVACFAVSCGIAAQLKLRLDKAVSNSDEPEPSTVINTIRSQWFIPIISIFFCCASVIPLVRVRSFPYHRFLTDLSGAELRGTTLQSVDLSGDRCDRATFDGADLERAVFDNSMLYSASLDQADLQYAFLRETQLTKASLNGTKLKYADMRYAVLTDAKAKGIDCENASLVGADLSDSDLRDAQLKYSDLTGCAAERSHLAEADLRNAHACQAFLNWADMSSCDAVEATFSGAHLSHANLTGAILDRASFNAASFEQAKLTNARFESADVRQAQLPDCVGRDVIFRNADLSDANLRHVRLTTTDFRSVLLDRTDFSESIFSDADFTRATSFKAVFTDCRFEQPTLFTRAKLDSADFLRAILVGADFSQGECIGCNFRECHLEKAIFKSRKIIGGGLRGAELRGTDFSDTELRNVDFTDAVDEKQAIWHNAKIVDCKFFVQPKASKDMDRWLRSQKATVIHTKSAAVLHAQLGGALSKTTQTLSRVTNAKIAAPANTRGG